MSQLKDEKKSYIKLSAPSESNIKSIHHRMWLKEKLLTPKKFKWVFSQFLSNLLYQNSITGVFEMINEFLKNYTDHTYV